MRTENAAMKAAMDYMIETAGADCCSRCVYAENDGDDDDCCSAFEKDGIKACRKGMIRYFREEI